MAEAKISPPNQYELERFIDAGILKVSPVAEEVLWSKSVSNEWIVRNFATFPLITKVRMMWRPFSRDQLKEVSVHLDSDRKFLLPEDMWEGQPSDEFHWTMVSSNRWLTAKFVRANLHRIDLTWLARVLAAETFDELLDLPWMWHMYVMLRSWYTGGISHAMAEYAYQGFVKGRLLINDNRDDENSQVKFIWQRLCIAAPIDWVCKTIDRDGIEQIDLCHNDGCTWDHVLKYSIRDISYLRQHFPLDEIPATLQKAMYVNIAFDGHHDHLIHGGMNATRARRLVRNYSSHLWSWIADPESAQRQDKLFTSDTFEKAVRAYCELPINEDLLMNPALTLESFEHIKHKINPPMLEYLWDNRFGHHPQYAKWREKYESQFPFDYVPRR